MSRITQVLLALVLALPTLGQQIVHRSLVPTAPFTETDFVTPLTPLPDPAPNAATPRFLPLGGPGFPLGDLTFDNATGLIWETDGFLVQATPNGRYAPLLPPVPPTPPGLPPLTGLAIDSATATLFATDGSMLYAVLAAPPFPPVAAPVPLAFPAIAPPFTGLDFESSSGLIYACDAGGYVYYFTTGGLPSGPNPVFVPPGPVPPATDLAARPGLLPGMFVQFLGLGLIDYTSGGMQPAAMTGIAPGTEAGVAFHAHPASLGGGCGCSAPGFGPMVNRVSAPPILGAVAHGYLLTGGPAASPVLFALDLGVTGPTPLGGGCTYWLSFPPFVLLGAMTDALGNAFVPLEIPALPFLGGLTVAAQWGAPCPASPSTFVLSDALRSILMIS